MGTSDSVPGEVIVQNKDKLGLSFSSSTREADAHLMDLLQQQADPSTLQI